MKKADIEKQLAEHPDTVFASSTKYGGPMVLEGEFGEHKNGWPDYTTTKGFRARSVLLIRADLDEDATDWRADAIPIIGAEKGRTNYRSGGLVTLAMVGRVLANDLDEYAALREQDRLQALRLDDERRAAQGRTKHLADEFVSLFKQANTEPVYPDVRQGYVNLTLTDSQLGTLNGYIDAALSITPSSVTS